jgi:hypothetical protein
MKRLLEMIQTKRTPLLVLPIVAAFVVLLGAGNAFAGVADSPLPVLPGGGKTFHGE